ncbi:flagellar hook-basal body complex protein FliE [Altererythrobacter buctensis]|uniref:Flagellar hook-basal body complex protein FliE n=2 Tax=Alteraurantiacibacter buctensis TaxID=1503981 RepID=A0A844YW39_9SPHN|nr:flagellar hook-basal body complex protein FliE [Alteraurantiacibacter buctensis]
MSTIGSGMGAAQGSLQQVMALRRQLVEQSDSLKTLRQAGASEQAEGPRPAAGGGFADTLQSTLDQVNQMQARSEQMSTAYERGEVTDIAQVMLARQEAGVAFEATLQVRNKLLSAYQDIMRMGV